MNKIALFKPAKLSLTGWLICLVTRCPYSHAAVYVGGEGWFHSSESVGYFDVLKVADFAERECVMFEFKGDLRPWLKRMKHVGYDWKGMLGWLFKADDKSRFYCFETALSALNECGVGEYIRPVNGCYIKSHARYVRRGLFRALCNAHRLP